MGNGVPITQQKPPFKLLLKHHLSPGDVVVMTAALESLHKQYPGQYVTDVDTTCQDIWKHNPRITKLVPGQCAIVEMHYNAINDLSRRDVSFMGAFCEHLGQQIGKPVPVRVTKPCLYLSPEENTPLDEVKDIGPYVVVNAGHKNDYTAKGAGADIWQGVVDHFRGRVQFVQIGEDSPHHNHPRLSGVVDMIGQTDVRRLFRLVKHSIAAMGTVTFLLHVAAAFDVPYICLGGGREEQGWIAYNSTRYLHTFGQLDCCKEKACWKSRTVPLHDGDSKDGSLCVLPVVQPNGESVPKCLAMIGSAGVIAALSPLVDSLASLPTPTPCLAPVDPAPKKLLHVHFDHGAGDCVHFAGLLQLYKRRGWDVSVNAEQNKLAIWQAAGIKTVSSSKRVNHHDWKYWPGFNEPLAANDWSGNKTAMNLNVAPLPNIGDRGELWEELCGIDMEDSFDKMLNPALREQAFRFLQGLPRPIVLLHSKGTNFQSEKSIPDDTTRELYRLLLEGMPGSVVVLDWDNRVPVIQHERFRGIKPAWGHISLVQLAALYEQSSLLIGVDSGPYHLAAMTRLPALGVFHHFAPWCVSLPRPSGKNRVLCREYPRDVVEARRERWKPITYPGSMPTAREIANAALGMLGSAYNRPLVVDGLADGREVVSPLVQA